jgi:hypothetical protein
VRSSSAASACSSFLRRGVGVLELPGDDTDDPDNGDNNENIDVDVGVDGVVTIGASGGGGGGGGGDCDGGPDDGADGVVVDDDSRLVNGVDADGVVVVAAGDCGEGLRGPRGSRGTIVEAPFSLACCKWAMICDAVIDAGILGVVPVIPVVVVAFRLLVDNTGIGPPLLPDDDHEDVGDVAVICVGDDDAVFDTLLVPASTWVVRLRR